LHYFQGDGGDIVSIEQMLDALINEERLNALYEFQGMPDMAKLCRKRANEYHRAIVNAFADYSLSIAMEVGDIAPGASVIGVKLDRLG
jgi:hypothetical protein